MKYPAQASVALRKFIHIKWVNEPSQAVCEASCDGLLTDFGARVEGQTYGTATTTPPGLNLLRLEESLSAAHLRLHNVYVEHLDWRACVAKYDRSHTFFLMDPPYWQTEGYGLEFGWDQYVAIAEVLRTIKGKAIVTLNDHPAIRELFAGFHIERADHRYTVGGGAGKEVSEVFIFSWDLASDPVGLF